MCLGMDSGTMVGVMACVMVLVVAHITCLGLGRGIMVGVVTFVMTHFVACITCLDFDCGTVAWGSWHHAWGCVMHHGTSGGTRYVSWHRLWNHVIDCGMRHDMGSSTHHVSWHGSWHAS